MGPLRARPVVDAARASKRHPDGGITSTAIPPHVSTDSIRTATRNATTNLMPQRFLISTVQGCGRPIEAGDLWSWWRSASAGCATVLLSTLLSLSESKYLAEKHMSRSEPPLRGA